MKNVDKEIMIRAGKTELKNALYFLKFGLGAKHSIYKRLLELKNELDEKYAEGEKHS